MDFTAKGVGLLVEKFGKFVRAAVYPYGRSFWRKTTSRNNLVFHLILGLREEIILIRINLVCSLLTRLRFLILELHFEILFQQFWIFSLNSGFQYESLPYLARKFRHSRQKCFLRVQRKIWRKIGFRLQIVTVFNNIWTLHKHLSDFWWESAARSLGLHSTCTRARFEKITVVSEKYVSFIIMGLGEERKKIWLSTIFCPHCCQNFILSLQNNNLIFFNNFYPIIFFQIRARIVETFYAIYLARLLKLQTTSIDKQSEETPSSRKKIVLRIFSWLGEENNLTSDNFVSALLTRLRFSVLDLNFEIFFLQF